MLSEKEAGGLQITCCESTTAKCHKINVLKIPWPWKSKSWKITHTLIYYFFQLFFHKNEITHTFNKSDRRVSMSVVTDGILSTHWQYSRIILINSNTVLPKKKRERERDEQVGIQEKSNWFRIQKSILILATVQWCILPISRASRY